MHTSGLCMRSKPYTRSSYRSFLRLSKASSLGDEAAPEPEVPLLTPPLRLAGTGGTITPPADGSSLSVDVSSEGATPAVEGRSSVSSSRRQSSPDEPGGNQPKGRVS